LTSDKLNNIYACEDNGGVYKYLNKEIHLFYDPSSPLKGRGLSTKFLEMKEKGISNKNGIDFFDWNKSLRQSEGWQCLCDGEPMFLGIQTCNEKESTSLEDKGSATKN